MVVCDLDGTLVDSVPDLTYCVDEMLGRLGLAPVGEAKVRQWVGNGVERLVGRALVGGMEGEPAADLLARALPVFLDLYAANISRRSRLFPGVPEGLAGLARLRIPLVCLTNKIARYTVPLMEELGISAFFSLVLSGDSLPEKKPSPLPLLYAAEHFGVPPESGLMVGDSITDVQAARAAGLPVVCLSYGYNHGLDIRTSHPDAVIDSLARLPALLEEDGP
jgi:phosphoglycolate phosphatase